MQGRKIGINVSLTLSLWLMLSGAWLLTGCSTFSREWRESAAVEKMSQPLAFSPVGRWEGTWKSAVNGHEGKVRAVVKSPAAMEPVKSARAKKFRAPVTYEATWGWLLRGRFPGEQEFEPLDKRGSAWRSRGEWILPAWAGGVYEFEITLKGDECWAQYRGGGDAGVFHLQRKK